jgi:hypothetical protein
MSQIRSAMRILISALREIFDEAAYDRFLQSTHASRSSTSYRAFWRERESRRPKPRCC